jgi:hypothetical protein
LWVIESWTITPSNYCGVFGLRALAPAEKSILRNFGSLENFRNARISNASPRYMLAPMPTLKAYLRPETPLTWQR